MSKSTATRTGPSASALNPMIGRRSPPSTTMKSSRERSDTKRPFLSLTTAVTDTRSTADLNLVGAWAPPAGSAAGFAGVGVCAPATPAPMRSATVVAAVSSRSRAGMRSAIPKSLPWT